MTYNIPTRLRDKYKQNSKDKYKLSQIQKQYCWNAPAVFVFTAYKQFTIQFLLQSSLKYLQAWYVGYLLKVNSFLIREDG